MANKKRLPPARTEIVPPGLPVPRPKSEASLAKPSPAEPPAPLSKAAELLEKLGFCPITEMVRMYRDNKTVVVTKDGGLVEVELDPASRIKLLSELVSYGHAKSKPTDPKIQGTVINLTINKF